MVSKNKKAASFFLFDAVIAAIIFFVAVSLILTSLDVSPEVESTRVYGEDLIQFYMTTPVGAIADEEITNMALNGTIENPANTLLEQILVFYHDNQTSTNSNFISQISDLKIPSKFSFNISVSNSSTTETLYSRQQNYADYTSFTKVRRLGIARLNDGSLYGPLIVTVSVWY